MSEAKIQNLERITENVESDTDNENDIDKKKNPLKKKNDDQYNMKNNAKGNSMVFNQSNQNFAKFSQMAKNNNQSSFSDQSNSKDDKSNEDDDLPDEKEENVKSQNKAKITKDNKTKTEANNSDSNNDFYKNYDNNSDSDLGEKDISRNNYRNINIMESEKQTMKLNFFNIDQFMELNIDQEYKGLVTIMKKFDVDKNILSLDTKMKPFIPNFLPSIGEVDAFLKINRPDNKIEELGLDTVDEPTINGIDPSVFSLELSYKMKVKVPENFIIKSIENADKNTKQISNWIENLESLHKETSNNFVNYSKKMPELEELMQVRQNLSLFFYFLLRKNLTNLGLA